MQTASFIILIHRERGRLPVTFCARPVLELWDRFITLHATISLLHAVFDVGLYTMARVCFAASVRYNVATAHWEDFAKSLEGILGGLIDDIFDSGDDCNSRVVERTKYCMPAPLPLIRFLVCVVSRIFGTGWRSRSYFGWVLVWHDIYFEEALESLHDGECSGWGRLDGWFCEFHQLRI